MLSSFDPHVTRIELREAILANLNLKGWKRKDLARVADIEPVTISNLLNNKQRFMLYQLDAITEALDLPAGHFYSYFKAECCNDEGRIQPGKCGAFIVNCLEHKQEKVAEDFLHLLFEETSLVRRIRILLEIAEAIYRSDLRAESLSYYEKVIETEQKLTDRLAIAYYRRFLLVREQPVSHKVFEAFYQFLAHLHRLPVHLRFEAYVAVLLTYSLIEEWNELLRYATQLEEVATKTGDETYLGEALRYKVIALCGQGKREEAVTITEQLAAINEHFAKIASSFANLLSMNEASA